MHPQHLRVRKRFIIWPYFSMLPRLAFPWYPCSQQLLKSASNRPIVQGRSNHFSCHTSQLRVWGRSHVFLKKWDQSTLLGHIVVLLLPWTWGAFCDPTGCLLYGTPLLPKLHPLTHIPFSAITHGTHEAPETSRCLHHRKKFLTKNTFKKIKSLLWSYLKI